MKYTPDKWIIIKIKSKPIHYRVFGSWVGGYLDGDSWRFNSGITKVESLKNNYLIYGHSGSIYEVSKDMYGIAGSYNQAILNKYIENGEVEYMPEDTDWLNFNFND